MKPIVLTLLAAAMAALPASGRQCTRSAVEALGVETLDTGYTILYSPGHFAHAERIADDLDGVREFIDATYGVDPDFAIALLDEDDWNQIQPACSLAGFGSPSLRFDLEIRATPVERDAAFEHCDGMLGLLTQEERETFEQAAGETAGTVCYGYAYREWMNLLGIQLAYRYFGSRYQEDIVWPNNVNAFLFAATIKSNLMPEAARVDSTVASTFRQFHLGKYGKPDVREYEAHAAEWLMSDVDHFTYYLDWFAELGYDRNAEFGSSFPGVLRNVLSAKPLPTTTEEWTDRYEEAKEGLKSILLKSEDAPAELPTTVTLESAYPNPFNPSTTVVYSLPAAARVALSLHDVTGRIVRTINLGFVPAGRHETLVDADGLASGIYLVRLESGPDVRTMAVTLVR